MTTDEMMDFILDNLDDDVSTAEEFIEYMQDLRLMIESAIAAATFADERW